MADHDDRPSAGSLQAQLSVILQYRSGHPDSEDILDLFERLIDRPYRTHALIYGEAGTGKEGLARALHHLMNPGREAPFVKMPAGGRDPAILAQHIFGTSDRRGAIDRAQGGTLFLDEIATLPREIQARLSPVLRGRFRRNDDETPRPCDVTVIGATDHDLGPMVAAGEVRHDLYYRLSRLELTIPPLRERHSDIVTAALWTGNRVLERYGERRLLSLEGDSDPDDLVLTQGAASILRQHDFPGNFRELDRIMERALMLYRDGDRVTGADVQRAIG